MGALFTIIYLAVLVFVLAGMWKAFVKAGKPGWACIIPVYNLIVALEIAEKPIWWIVLLLFVPIANIVVLFMVHIAIAEHFGKGGGFGVGLVFLPFIFWPILGYGPATYAGAAPAAPPIAQAPPPAEPPAAEAPQEQPPQA